MKYQELVNVYSALEETTKRLEKTEIILDIIKDLDEETLEQVGLLILGTIFPAWSDEEIGIGTKLVTKAVADATGTTVDKVEDAVREERRISNELQKMILDKEKLKIIHENSNKKNIVYLESVLLIRFFYVQEEYEDEWIKITGKYFPNLNSPIKEITINSPLGKALYLKKIGSKVKYVANQKDLQVEILEKR